MKPASVVLTLALLTGCTSGGRPPVVVPTPVPVPTPTPKPPVNVCLPAPPLEMFECKNVGQLRVVIDCTPKTCMHDGNDWSVRCSTGVGCAPGGQENDPLQRQLVETQWGPYTWTVTDSIGESQPCVSCFLDGGNPLRLVAPGYEGKTIRITGGNGVFAEVIGSHP